MNSLSTLWWSFIFFNITLYNFGILDRADPHTKCDIRINQGIKEQRLVNLVPSLRSRPSSQRMVYDPESLMHFTLASAKPSLAARNQRSRMKSPTPLLLAFLLPTLLCQQKKGHVAANSCAMLCQCCAHQGSYQVSISLFLCHLMFCKTIIKEWDRIGRRTEILAGYHVSSSWYRPSTLSPAWQSHWVWRCEICSAMFSVNSWKPSALTDASLTPCDVILWWAGQPCGWPSSPLATADLPYLPSKSITKPSGRTENWNFFSARLRSLTWSNNFEVAHLVVWIHRNSRHC